ncbi:peptide deformylase [Rhodobacter ferrooxidans]|uniref:Peptide deformylase n=1 Tax=Rhodobacter ferrooxidans TaxID=371731 RepID=C8RYS6_9RHOB|nr:peptide deformylase [Rhodobacter sp. SW2]EEW26264.1 peptide deformylase [Rhodobacter sp. SW2]
MPVLPILCWPDARLATPCDPVAPGADLRALAADMLATMYAATGRGLAAPQIGILQRVFVMDTGWKEGRPAPQVLVNPEILWRSEACKTVAEGCLSLPGISPDISRPAEIRLRWRDLDGTPHEAHLTGFAATCAQHEIDHLDGILTLDHLAPEARARAEALVAA